MDSHLDNSTWEMWFATVAGILMLFGLAYCVLGLKILPVHPDVLIDWESALYGAIMLGWGFTLMLVGRRAFRTRDSELLLIVLGGILLWLLVEAIASFYLRVYFNVGVDVAVAALFTLPILKARRAFTTHRREESRNR